jgi:hypothetical protein
MKTIEDLRTLFPTLIDLVATNDHEIGESYIEQDEEGWGRTNDYEENSVTYEEDGWSIEISYRCCGEWDNDMGDYWTPASCSIKRAWGEVTEICACHYDDDTDEETVFSDEDLKELYDEINNMLDDIA